MVEASHEPLHSPFRVKQRVIIRTGTMMMLTFLASVAALVGWQVTQRSGGSAMAGLASKSSAVAVEVAPVSSGMVRDVRMLSGTLEASGRFSVAARVDGLITEMSVDLGDKVTRGQIVAKIDSSEYRQAVAQAEAELAVRNAARTKSVAALKLAESDYRRTADLHTRGMASDTEMDEQSAAFESAEADVLLAKAQVEQAEATLELSRIRLGYTQVRAEWEGAFDEAVVSERFQDAGNTIEANMPVVSVVSLNPLTAVVHITERDYTRLTEGQIATLKTDAVPGRTFDATIVRIAPVFRESSRQARVELSVDNSEFVLKPGMFVRASIVLSEEFAETIVPYDAITRRNDQQFVFALNEAEDAVRMIPIEAGIVEDRRVQLLGEPLTGRVVVLGQQLLKDGTSVHVATSPSATPDEQ